MSNTRASSSDTRSKSSRERQYEINNYMIKSTIGQGTFGKVRLGVYLPTNEKVAIKIWEKSKIKEKDDYIRVERELDMIRVFNHPNVILVSEIFEDAKTYYIVMDYCGKGELFNYIVKKRRLSEEEASFFFFQWINGLEYIHKHGIVHRDWKPENLLWSENNILKIIDFGLSNYFEKKLLSTPCGSPCYASPEMVSGNKYNGFRIDVWSSGIILFAMLCGYLPFEDKDNEIWFKKIIKCKLDYPKHLSSISKDLIKRIWVTDPNKRMTIAEIKMHHFFKNGEALFNQQFPVINRNLSESSWEDNVGAKSHAYHKTDINKDTTKDVYSMDANTHQQKTNYDGKPNKKGEVNKKNENISNDNDNNMNKNNEKYHDNDYDISLEFEDMVISTEPNERHVIRKDNEEKQINIIDEHINKYIPITTEPTYQPTMQKKSKLVKQIPNSSNYTPTNPQNTGTQNKSRQILNSMLVNNILKQSNNSNYTNRYSFNSNSGYKPTNTATTSKSINIRISHLTKPANASIQQAISKTKTASSNSHVDHSHAQNKTYNQTHAHNKTTNINLNIFSTNVIWSNIRRKINSSKPRLYEQDQNATTTKSERKRPELLFYDMLTTNDTKSKPTFNSNMNTAIKYNYMNPRTKETQSYVNPNCMKHKTKNTDIHDIIYRPNLTETNTWVASHHTPIKHSFMNSTKYQSENNTYRKKTIENYNHYNTTINNRGFGVNHNSNNSGYSKTIQNIQTRIKKWCSKDIFIKYK